MIVFEAIAALLIVLGAGFVFVGSLGLAILPDMMRRLHAPTKASTIGLGAILVGSIVYSVGVRGEFTIHEVLITLFIFITAPVSGMMIAKAHILTNRAARAELTETRTPSGWATLDPSPKTVDRLPPPQRVD
jgi:multicomponent K+:H+ antiporter subunit G